MKWDLRAVLTEVIALVPLLAIVAAAITLIIRKAQLKVSFKIVMMAVALYVMGIGLLAFMWWPALFGTSPRVLCQKNMMQIDVALFRYAADHYGAFPNSFGQLLDERYLDSPRVLLCPGTRHTVPKDVLGAASESQVLGRVGEWSEYILIPGLTKDSPGRGILIYDRFGNHAEGGNVLFVDGHTEWLQQSEITRLLKSQLGEPQAVAWPDAFLKGNMLQLNQTLDHTDGEKYAINVYVQNNSQAPLTLPGWMNSWKLDQFDQLHRYTSSEGKLTSPEPYGRQPLELQLYNYGHTQWLPAENFILDPGAKIIIATEIIQAPQGQSIDIWYTLLVPLSDSDYGNAGVLLRSKPLHLPANSGS